MLGLVLLTGCGGEGPGARLEGPGDGLHAQTGERDGRLHGELRVTLDEDLPAGARLRLDQGYVEDGMELFGTELRYRLPDLVTDMAGTPFEVHARLEPPAPGNDSPTTRALRPAEGWFEVTVPTPWRRTQTLVLGLGREGDLSSGPLTPTVPLELELHAFLLREEKAPQRLDGAVPVRIADTGADWLRVIGPARARPGEGVELTVVFMSGLPGPLSTAMVARDVPSVMLRADVADTVVVQGIGEFGSVPRPLAFHLELPELPEGVHRIEVGCPERPELRGLSSPIVVSAEGAGPWFGSLHNHTTPGGHAAGTPRRALRYAREIARLDFCGLTEHAEADGFDWELLRRLEREETRTGSFVAFAGFEWTHSRAGHRHVVFRDSARGSALAASGPAGVATATDLDSFRARIGTDPNALVVVHHPLWKSAGVQENYDWGPPDGFPRQRLAEVYSWHGCSLEHGSVFPIHGDPRHELDAALATDVLAALRRGHDVALVADGDDHLGRPGSLVAVRWPRALRYAYHGLIAVEADALTRMALFDALDAGRTYGTTGARMIVAAEPVGSRVRVRVHAAAPLLEIRLRSTEAVLDQESWEPVAPTRGTPEAGLYLDAEVGVWDVEVTLEAGQDPGPWIVECIQQNHHHAWMRVDSTDR